MKKIGIVTVYTGYNYGSALQAFATTKTILKFGMKGNLLKLRGDLIAGRDVRLKKLLTVAFRTLIHNGGKDCIKSYINSISKKLPETSMLLFDSFAQKELCPVKVSYSELKKKANSDEYIAFLCGSDQIWNSTAFYVDPFYYLQFAPMEKRIAFAPSFGKEYIPNYNKKKIARYLSEIPYKSVRENSGAHIIRELIDENAEVLIDPTLVLTPDEWKKELNLKKTCDDKYLLAYFLDNPSELAIKTIKLISSQYDLKVIGLPYKLDNLPWEVESAGPKEFVEYINNASFVCTDSFHGTAFSLNFNIPFYTFERNYGSAEKQSTRIKHLLSMMEATERLEPKEINKSMILSFNDINKKLFQQRNKTYDYLKKILNSKHKVGGEKYDK